MKHGTRWVILGGDSSTDPKVGIPDRDTDHSGFYKYTDIPTDLYYIGEGDWDADDDGVFGEFADDRSAVNYTNAKASIGRIPVRTADEVAAYTAKVIAYEAKYPTTQFAARMVYTCPERGAYPKLRTSRKTLVEKWKGDAKEYFASNTPWDDEKPGDHDHTPANWIEMIK